MRLLVTGGAGFIGSEFVRRLLRADPSARVTVFDALTYSGVEANLASVAHCPGYRFVRGDVCDPGAVDEVMAGQDAVVHFAAESHVDRSIRGAGPFVRTNVTGTQVLLDAALRHRVGRFVQVSTDEVYGSIGEGSWTEEWPLTPNSPYSASKGAADLLALSYHRTHGLDVVVTRCTNNYGPHQFPEKVVPLFITRLLDGLTVPLYGDGRHIRDWLHVSDHCRGIELVLLSGRPGEVYHIGGGTELSNHKLTGLLLDAVGADWDRVVAVPDRKGHDLRYSLDDSKIREQLGYLPVVPFAEGLAATVDWYREHRHWWEPLRARSEQA
ncbi:MULTISPECIES: dTDP-glucose 4,6-dehydratase [Streptomyces]|uniref:dTDP-glucose 4,6-dehydratase n=1 Tax=Streptomyces tsukubensis (strain DSM 42081 / NBRC 108919 / NRRL 18488 / 9993) TaxID=1114943 RepID=I2N828_STRT9|nr:MULTISPECIES: dTDP-glucose 4,6-dehydratase [Streptomyces]AZK96995.1 dTDP-glucose 4,6-dehydratase [Streptomyces tsukubensis]EIF93175.1 putative dTDP-glucose 4,6-dehydratase [Streptomyces tsukubensis NRRL18488]MYS66570.1 dTDP-glucose 4,6-dehydratase [Streptomyces sp. SID5473]QKM67024.1 dTDP-glucose 4,6-dehydratase [Streptomyces tsukubensis NRRL18488]TAI41497.1 dTDP-glucose 4,6-dehydratase [Streptomyces tsukubensis]